MSSSGSSSTCSSDSEVASRGSCLGSSRGSSRRLKSRLVRDREGEALILVDLYEIGTPVPCELGTTIIPERETSLPHVGVVVPHDLQVPLE